MKAIALRAILLLFCATVLLSTGTGYSLSAALSRSVAVCLIATIWGLILKNIYFKMIHPTLQARDDEEIEEESAIAHEDAA